MKTKLQPPKFLIWVVMDSYCQIVRAYPFAEKDKADKFAAWSRQYGALHVQGMKWDGINLTEQDQRPAPLPERDWFRKAKPAKRKPSNEVNSKPIMDALRAVENASTKPTKRAERVRDAVRKPRRPKLSRQPR